MTCPKCGQPWRGVIANLAQRCEVSRERVIGVLAAVWPEKDAAHWELYGDVDIIMKWLPAEIERYS